MTLPNGYNFPDVSHFRTVCDWNAYSGYPVSACKATEGATGKDSYYAEWLANMRGRGLFPIIYHFLRRESSITGQVNNYLSRLDGQPFGVMLDIETSGSATNPTITQAHEWFNGVSAAIGIPRSQMLTYMSRSWWSAFGGGATVLSDTILWNAHYSNSPNLSPYAGDNVEIIQFSSSAPIAGLCSPFTGDMNIAIGMSAAELIDKIHPTEPPPPPEDTLSAAEVAEIKTHITNVAYDKGPYLAKADDHNAIWVVYKQTGEKRWVNSFDWYYNTNEERVYNMGLYPVGHDLAGFPIPWERSKLQLADYITVGPVPEGW